MKLLLSITIAAVYGVSLRMLFSSFGDELAVMSISFFFLVPYFVGYLTILLIPYRVVGTRRATSQRRISRLASRADSQSELRANHYFRRRERL